MKFMMIVKANEESEAGQLPTEEMISEMMGYNEQLAKAGVLVDLSGLQPSSKGARVRFGRSGVSVSDGPFSATNELIAGYWIIDVPSREAALDWAKKIPFRPSPNGYEPEVEIRQFFELEDFGDSPAIERAKEFEKEFVGKN